MGVSLSPAAGAPAAGARAGLHRLMRVLALVRYRFFLYAGLVPYGLGAAWAWWVTGRCDAQVFLAGLGGVALAVVGVEAFNEYFDSRMGTDRVFNPDDLPPMSVGVLVLGIAGFAGALLTGLYLTRHAGWPILLFAGLGGVAAVFYVAPPIRWAYRGLGETVIGLSYGPWMVLGSLYLHAQIFAWGALWASLVPGLLIASLAVVNAIPDFHQDRLVGKRNLVVRLGRQRAVWLYTFLALAAFGVIVAGVYADQFPPTALASLLALPLLAGSARAAAITCETPRAFTPAIRRIVICYVVTVGLFTASVAASAFLGAP
jgi:1,4-dihydroxy-2-naphthoate octaprenyltransferase